VNAYLFHRQRAARAKSDAYFEGGYRLLVADTLCAGRVSHPVVGPAFAQLCAIPRCASRDRSSGKPRFMRREYLVVTTVLTFPLTLYEGFFREHAYNLQSDLFQWFGELGSASP
jgi:STE24 endopeptidase